MKRELVPWVLVVGIALTYAFGARAQRHAQAEQREFSAEDEGVQRPAAIPQSVLDILAKDDGVRNLMEDEDPPLKSIPASWFSASEVHLAGPNEKDLIVVGVGELRGANVVTFWVFRPVAGGYELVLTGASHDLAVKKTRWKGYREIELSGATAVEFFSTTFRWDGTKYVNFREESHEIR
ncbi:MAG TPA: hypothetical protein VGR47_21535 [Terracidiphilus sp.]|nr:hypothetical protein [Terracidiphilus sp.]